MKQNDEKIERYCKFCEYAGTLTDPDKMICRHHGIVSASHICRKFRYDPMKRVPARKNQELSFEYIDV